MNRAAVLIPMGTFRKLAERKGEYAARLAFACTFGFNSHYNPDKEYFRVDHSPYPEGYRPTKKDNAVREEMENALYAMRGLKP